MIELAGLEVSISLGIADSLLLKQEPAYFLPCFVWNIPVGMFLFCLFCKRCVSGNHSTPLLVGLLVAD